MSGDSAWAFAKAFYAQPGVSENLIRLQDEYAVDVPLVLILLEAARRGAALETAAVQSLAVAAADWQHDVVAPLRAVRRALKSSAQDPAGELYSQILEVELAAEECAIRQLAAKLPVEGSLPPVDAARANLEAYRYHNAVPQDAFAAVEAAFGATLG